MGQSTKSDIVKNVAYLGKHKELIAIIEELNEEFCGDEQADLTKDIRGWTLISPHYKNSIKSGKKKSLDAERLQKDGKEVFLLNTSEYESVGDYDYVVYADDKTAVETFLKDFNLNTTIEDMDSVCQTL
jgi:hypothetical protein